MGRDDARSTNLVARKGKIIYQKNFGHHTQSKKNSVKDNDIYDVASLTKILATTPMIMELFDREILTMETKLSEMLPEYTNSNKKNINLRQMLSHYARLKAWIPFYTATLDSVTKQQHPNIMQRNLLETSQLKLQKIYICVKITEIASLSR